MSVFATDAYWTRNIAPHAHAREQKQVGVFVALDVVVGLHLVVGTQLAPSRGAYLWHQRPTLRQREQSPFHIGEHRGRSALQKRWQLQG